MNLHPENNKPCILVVDDSSQNLVFISDQLRAFYTVRVASSGRRAIELICKFKIDLILLDIKMPEMDGYEVCLYLKKDEAYSGIPIIFLTSVTNEDDHARGLSIGAVDYIIKPISPSILRARVSNHLQFKAASDFLRDRSHSLEQEVKHRLTELSDVQEVTITALAALAEARDNDTGNHILRTQFYVRALANACASQSRFKDFLDQASIDMLYKSAALHDIGKVGIPDYILLKPGKLTAEEFEIMKTHTTLGFHSLENAERRLGKPAPFLRFAKEIAHHHQEKWDGSGYPMGLAGQQIPLSARLMAIADVYDALISVRVYKTAMSHESAVSVILEGRGSHFDPDLVDIFELISDEFRDIALRFKDQS